MLLDLTLALQFIQSKACTNECYVLFSVFHSTALICRGYHGISEGVGIEPRTAAMICIDGQMLYIPQLDLTPLSSIDLSARSQSFGINLEVIYTVDQR
jgi:hypothetical protein